MSEHTLVTQIGSDVEVLILFDYQPYEKPELNYPGCASQVTINAVYVDSDKGKDLLDTLSEEIFAGLEEQCEDSLTQDTLF